MSHFLSKCIVLLTQFTSVSLHMCFIIQSGDSLLILAAMSGRTEVVSLLVKAGAALDLQDQVNMWHHCVCVLI